ncbi:MAG: phosphatidate cytidylyltransferase [Clostridia bacterium]|nr:phosphatidate cytidylyltransferase [Clostridia bacterium]
MLIRIITSIVALCVLIPVLIFSNTWILPIAITFACIVANYEILKCIGTVKKYAVSGVLLFVSLIAPMLTRLLFLKLATGAIEFYMLTMAVICMVVVLYLMAVLVFSRKKISVSDVAISFFSSFYVTVGFSSIILLHDCSYGGPYTYLLIFIGAWITDIFAYFCGRLFGKHKLIPEISPKKTVEGSIGGTLFTGVAFVIFGLVGNHFGFNDVQSYIKLFVFGIIAALVAQIGDLCMSALKRHYDVKDFGKIFPGHGGMLDRFDSIIAVSTVLLVMNIIVSSYKVIL